MLNNLQLLFQQNSHLHKQVDLVVLDSVDSTNQYILDHFDKSSLQAMVVVAKHQTHGRGRNNKCWLDAKEHSFLMSYGCVIEADLSSLSSLPLMVGVTLAEALHAYGLPVQLKWPNDLMLNSEKFGGILVETRKVRNNTLVVIGIGLNATGVPELNDAPYKATDMDLPREELTPLMVAVVDKLHTQCLSIEKQSEWFLKYNDYNLLKGKHVCATIQGKNVHGFVEGVDEYGRLLVRNGCKKFTVVDATVREV